MAVSPRPCPCGLSEPFDACCGRYLGESDTAAPTAEALMRSRYTAFARGDVEHLLRTWHPATRPTTLTLDPSIRWTHLEVLDRVGGGIFDTDGVVEFRAHHREGQQRGVLHERSHFVREAGQWLYRDGVAR
jgi:SEC-C motif domain protein